MEFLDGVIEGIQVNGTNLKMSKLQERMAPCVLHRIDDQDAIWDGANRTNAQTTDPDLKEAEDWTLPSFEVPTTRT